MSQTLNEKIVRLIRSHDLTMDYSATTKPTRDQEIKIIETQRRSDLMEELFKAHFGLRLIDEDTPKDKPILGFVVDFDYSLESPLSLYGAHAEGLSICSEGFHVVVWGGGFHDSWEDGGGNLPDWWFAADSDFEKVANPKYWAPLPDGLPKEKEV